MPSGAVRLVVDPADVSDDALIGLLHAVYVDGGFVDRSVAERRMTAPRVRARGTLIGAFDGEALVGCVIVVAPGGESGQIAGPTEWEIHLLAVAEAARGRGVGQALLERAVALCFEAGAARVVLSTQPDMAAAHRLYARCGFERVPVRDWAVGGQARLAYLRR